MMAMGIVDQLLQRGRGWQITPIEVAFLGLTTGSALAQQPANVGLTFGRDAPGTHGDKLLAQPALGAVAPRAGCATGAWAPPPTPGRPALNANAHITRKLVNIIP